MKIGCSIVPPRYHLSRKASRHHRYAPSLICAGVSHVGLCPSLLEELLSLSPKAVQQVCFQTRRGRLASLLTLPRPHGSISPRKDRESKMLRDKVLEQQHTLRAWGVLAHCKSGCALSRNIDLNISSCYGHTIKVQGAQEPANAVDMSPRQVDV